MTQTEQVTIRKIVFTDEPQQSASQLAMLKAQEHLHEFLLGASAAQLHERSGVSQTYIYEALVILRDAPQLADEVLSGELKLETAYRRLRDERSNGAPLRSR